MLRAQIKQYTAVQNRNIPVFIPRCKNHCPQRGDTQKTRCDSDFLRTNMLADYLDKMSTDVNYIAYIEEEEDYQSYFQLFIVIAIFIYMFYAPKDR